MPVLLSYCYFVQHWFQVSFLCRPISPITSVLRLLYVYSALLCVHLSEKQWSFLSVLRDVHETRQMQYCLIHLLDRRIALWDFAESDKNSDIQLRV